MAEETKPPVVLAPGSPAPHFSLPGGSGKVVSLGDFGGKNVVLVYFYPKDDTPGCTKEACSLRDSWSALQAAGVVVLGISRDGAESHAAFVSKYKLPFELLTDADHAVHLAYGAWGQNPNPVWGVGPLRKSFLIGKDGNILHVFDKVDTEHHADQVLRALGAPVAPATSNVGGAVKQVVEAVKKVAVEVRKTETVQKAETAVRKAETAVSNVVEEVAQKPAVQNAARAVKKAVADAKKKPAYKKAAKVVKKAVADVKAGAKKVKKAIAGARKKGPAKKAEKPTKGKKAPAKAPSPARKPARKVVKKAARKPAAKPAPKKAKPAPKKKTAKGKGRR